MQQTSELVQPTTSRHGGDPRSRAAQILRRPEVLKGVSLTAHEGDVVAIIGGSGSGKSTMLRCINFLETPTSGRIVIGGEEIALRPDGTPANRKQIEHVRASGWAWCSSSSTCGPTRRCWKI